MNRNAQRAARGVITSLVATAAVVGASVPTFAASFTSPAISNSTQVPAVQLAQYRRDRGYHGTEAREFTGTISRVDYGQHAFRLYLDNGGSYHVDARDASVLLGERSVAFRDIPSSGRVTVQGRFTGRDTIVAREVRFAGGRYDRHDRDNHDRDYHNR